MAYKVRKTDLPEVLILEPQVYYDERGFFLESFNENEFIKATGHTARFVQDNHSRSKGGVLRGLHFQEHHPQGKLIRVVSGLVYDVAVDIRRSSPTFGKWTGVYLSAEEQRQLWIPPCFAHGFLVLSENADVLYKTTEYWHSDEERTILWNDEELDIQWPIKQPPILSPKDRVGMKLMDMAPSNFSS